MAATAVIGIVLVVIVGGIIRKMVKDKKAGKNLQCGCSCSDCHKGCCH